MLANFIIMTTNTDNQKQTESQIKTPKTKKRSTRTQPKVTLPSGSVIYLSNKELLKEIKLSKEQDQMTDNLARMLQLLCSRFALKGTYRNYSYNEDMQAAAMTSLVATWRSFDETKYSNPFAYFTQCVYHSFLQMLNKEKRHRITRDKLLIDADMNPSFSYYDEEQHMYSDYDPTDI